MTADDWSLLFRSATMCILALGLCAALCSTLFFKSYADPSILVSVIGLANFVLGYLAGKRVQSTDTTTTSNPTATTTQTTQT